jgi:hypothetical protein
LQAADWVAPSLEDVVVTSTADGLELRFMAV